MFVNQECLCYIRAHHMPNERTISFLFLKLCLRVSELVLQEDRDKIQSMAPSTWTAYHTTPSITPLRARTEHWTMIHLIVPGTWIMNHATGQCEWSYWVSTHLLNSEYLNRCICTGHRVQTYSVCIHLWVVPRNASDARQILRTQQRDPGIGAHPRQSWPA